MRHLNADGHTGEHLMSTCVLIPIKTNNERLPGKNTRPLKGHPLYAWLFKSLEGLECVEEVFVDSSDEGILDIAREWGYTPLKRPVEYNTDRITGDDLLTRVVDRLPHDLLALLHVTSPFLTPASVRQGVSLLTQDPSLDSVFGVVPIYNRLWYEGVPVNHDVHQLRRTQDLTPVCEESDVYFMRKKSLKRYGKRVCGKHVYFEMSRVEATDLDDLTDFVRAEALVDAGLVVHPFAQNTPGKAPA